MIVRLMRFGIAPLWAVVILGAETSLGDPDLGGPLARHYNFGCIKAAVVGSWSELADGTIERRGELWHTFPNAEAGLEAWGRYITEGAGGVYPALLAAEDWHGFAAVYYGAEVEGFEEYTAELAARAVDIRARARSVGLEW